MAKKDYNDEDGVWRTIGGRKVFIRKGQNLADAMIESGKFKGQKNKPGMRESFREEKEKDLQEAKDLRKKWRDNYGEEEYNDYRKKDLENADLYDDRNPEETRRQIVNELRQELSEKEYTDLIDRTARENVTNEELQEILNNAKPSLREMYRNDKRVTQQAEEEKRIKAQLDRERASWTDDDYAKRNRDIQDMKKNVQKSYDDLMEQARLSGNDKLEASAKQFRLDSLRDIDKLEKENRANYDEYRKNKSTNEEQERLDIARDIAKEMYQLNDKNSTQEKIDRYARDIMEYTDGEVTNETPYKDKNGNIQRSTQSLRDWREKLNKTKESSQSTNDYKVSNGNPVEDLISKKGINVGGRLREVDDEAKELFKTINEKNLNDEQAKFMLHSKYYDSNEDNLLDKYKEWKRQNQSTNETMNNAIREKASKNKYAGTKRWGFGYANDDNIPVYDNKIDYGGDFSHANLSSVSDSELKELYEKQSQLYNEAVNRGVGDRRTHNGRQSQIIKDVDLLRYGNGIQKVEEEMSKRGIKSNNMSETIRREANLKNAFRQYKREHPESKMTLNQFKKMNK